ncbi:MAG: hypothetical protein ABIO04_13020 [Ferruginibacter sp.]
MTRKKWALLVLFGLLAIGYFKLFYKTYSTSTVSQTADCIISLDVKRITNTIIWNTLTTPSEWKISFSSSRGISWKDMVKIPDYIFIFHAAGQPVNAWYTVFDKNSDNDFNEGLRKYGFKNTNNINNTKEYFSDQLGVVIICNENKILVGNGAVKDTGKVRQIADELFNKNEFVAKKFLEINIEAKSHLVMQLPKNGLFREHPVVTANFDKRRILVDALLNPNAEFEFAETYFPYSSSSLLSFGSTQPSKKVFALLDSTERIKISRLINFNIDSLIMLPNTAYTLDLQAVKQRVDSAISYTYDDNFNPVENVIVNNVTEPSFQFNICGNAAQSVYNYFKNDGKLESVNGESVFTPVPLVRSFCRVINDSLLSIVSGNYTPKVGDGSLHCIFFANIAISSFPAFVKAFLPEALQKGIANFETVQVAAKKVNNKLHLHCVFTKMKNSKPLISL